MKLRNKIFFIILLITLFGVVALNLSSKFTFLEEIRSMEEDKLRTDTQRIEALLANAADELHTLNQDWAYWDDTYEFVRNPSVEYRESNLGIATLLGIHLNAMLFYDLEGNLVQADFVDLEQEIELPQPEWLQSWLLENQFLNNHLSDDYVWSGIISTPPGPALISIRPIMMTDGSGPSAGTLIMLRYITLTVAEKFTNIMQQPFSLTPMNQVEDSPEFTELMKPVTSKTDIFIQYPAQNRNIIVAYKYLYNAQNDPIYVLSIEKPRQMYAQGVETMNFFSVLFLIFGVLCAAIFSYAIHSIFIRRVEQINNLVKKITNEQDLSIRIPVRNNDEITQLSEVINNMVERLDLAQDQALRFERRFRLVLESMKMIAIMLDENGLLTFGNMYFYDLCGYEPEEIIGRNWYDIFCPDYDRERLREALTGYIQGRSDHMYGENPIRIKNGEERLISWSNTLIIDRQGKVNGVSSIGEDITLKRKAEEQLKQSEATLQSILNAVPAGIGLIKDTKIIWINSRVEQFTGYTSSDLVGQSVSIFYPTEQIYLQVLEELRIQLQHHSSGKLQTTWIAKDGNPIEVEMRAAPIDPNEWSAGIIVTALDISEQVLAQQHLRESFDETKMLLSRMTALRNIDEAITSPNGTPETIHQVLHQIRKTLGLQVAIASLVDPKTRQFNVVGCDGLENGYCLSDLNILYPVGVLAAQESQELFASPVDTIIDLHSILKHLPANHQAEQYAAVPLLVKGQVLGVLEVLVDNDVCHSNDCREFLVAMALQLAIALDNANLLQERERAFNELQTAYEATIQSLAQALEIRDRETKNHSARVVAWTERLAKRMGYPSDQLEHLRRGVYLHDIGKIGIPDHILLKPGPLTAEEWDIMRKHPQHAYDLLKDIEYLQPALEIPYSHHERWDGSGYPHGLAGTAIPLGARIFAVIDIWDALTDNRPYRNAWSVSQTILYLKEQAGILVDPEVVCHFLDLLVEEGIIDTPGCL
jgi:PAS domain S-box-containing protein